MRVLEGMDGVVAESGTLLDRSYLDRLISSLSSRVFILHNVHEERPVVFMTRWAMSYLRGPLTRRQVKTLMSGVKINVVEPTEKAMPERRPQQVAETVRRQGEGSAAVGQGRHNGGTAGHHHHPAPDTSQVEADRPGGGKNHHHPHSDSQRGYPAALNRPRRPQPLGGVDAMAVVEIVICQVDPDLQQEGHGQGSQGGYKRKPPPGGSRRGAHQNGPHRRRKGLRPHSQKPGLQIRNLPAFVPWAFYGILTPQILTPLICDAMTL